MAARRPGRPAVFQKPWETSRDRIVDALMSLIRPGWWRQEEEFEDSSNGHSGSCRDSNVDTQEVGILDRALIL